MTQIKFTETELVEIQSFYKLELTKTLQRLEDIKSILKKLGSTEISTTNETSKSIARPTFQAQPNKLLSEKQSASKINIKSTISPNRKKLGKWPTFIIDTLKSSEKPMKTIELIPLVFKQFNATTKVDKAKADRNLRGHLLRMTRRNQIGSIKVSGQRDNLYTALIGQKR